MSTAADLREGEKRGQAPALDRLLFGDNQFFGVNHMSEEKARAQAMRFQDIGAVIEVLDFAYGEGLRTFMCTTHERIALVCDHMRAQPERYRDFALYPCMPYAHKYANAVTEDGMLGAVKRFLPDEGLVNAAIRGGSSLATKDIEGMTTLLIDAEMKMFHGLRTPVVFLQNIVVDLLLGLGFHDAFRVFADHVRERYDAEPGFITMNLPRPARRARAARDRQPDRLLQHQQDRLPHVRRPRELRGALREREFRAVAMSVFASGAIPPREAIEWVCAQPNVRSIVFGASSPANITQHAGAGRRALAAADHAARRLDRWAPEGDPPAAPAARRHRGPVPLGDLRHPPEPLAARRSRRSTSSPSSAAAIPLNVARNLTHAARCSSARTRSRPSSARVRRWPCRFSPVARARRIPCHYIESAARSDAPSMTGRLISKVPGVKRYSQYPGAEARLALPRLGLRLLRAAEGDHGARPGQLSKVVVTLGTYRGYPFTRLVRRLLQLIPSEVEVLWQTGDTDVRALGVAGHYAIPESDLTAAMREADLVVAHAGVGTALAAFEVGKRPLLVPRRFSLGEHVDDHQVQIAGELAERGLAVSADADNLSHEVLLAAATGSVARPAQAPIFATSGR